MAGNGKGYAWEPYFRDEHKARATRAYYYSMVQLIDEQLGQILAALDDRGFRENTLLIFTSDHGEMLGDHAIGQKEPLVYEGVTHIPLLIRYPQGLAPCAVEECVSLVDLLPPILDFAGIRDTFRRDGISLKRLLQEGTAPERSGVRIEYKEEPDRIRYKAWVTKEWKLAVYPGERFGELYDLRNDTGEKTIGSTIRTTVR
jgi:arylsulfatase A-like enzyme